MQVYQLEPFGTEANYIQSGIVASTIANVNRGPKQDAFNCTDFMPFHCNSGQQTAAPMFDPDPEKQSAIVEAFFKGIAANGK